METTMRFMNLVKSAENAGPMPQSFMDAMAITPCELKRAHAGVA
jgi:hypothetical protein